MAALWDYPTSSDGYYDEDYTGTTVFYIRLQEPIVPLGIKPVVDELKWYEGSKKKGGKTKYKRT